MTMKFTKLTESSCGEFEMLSLEYPQDGSLKQKKKVQNLDITSKNSEFGP